MPPHWPDSISQNFNLAAHQVLRGKFGGGGGGGQHGSLSRAKLLGARDAARPALRSHAPPWKVYDVQLHSGREEEAEIPSRN